MIIRTNPKALRVLAGSFIICALAIGVPYFSTAYAQVNLPNALWGWGLLLVFVAAAGIRITDNAGFLATAATLASVAPVVVMARVVRDTALDPTSHNLWPFELVIAGAVGVFVALVGTIAGSVVRVALNRKGEEVIN